MEAMKGCTRPIFTNWLGSSPETQKARKAFRDGGIPTYETPEKAIRAFMHLAHFSRIQNLLMEVPPSKGENFTPDEKTAKAIIDKAPSAELRPDQKDQDSLPPYDILDAILDLYVVKNLGKAEIIAQGFDAAVVNDVINKVTFSEYKRRQAAPGLKVSPRAFGMGRRIPIAQKFRAK